MFTGIGIPLGMPVGFMPGLTGTHNTSVLIGGFPLPSLTSIIVGLALRPVFAGLGKVVGAARNKIKAARAAAKAEKEAAEKAAREAAEAAKKEAAEKAAKKEAAEKVAQGAAQVKKNVPPMLRNKILYGERLANPNSPGGMSNKLIGGHSPRIKSHPDYAHEILSHNADGTTTVKFTKQFPDGNLSNIKKSTLAPDSWSDDKIIATTSEVSQSPVVDTRVQDGSTLHRQTVDGVQWEVIKDSSGNITSSYPTGGNPTSL
jgi:Bacterial EndoU nuclease